MFHFLFVLSILVFASITDLKSRTIPHSAWIAIFLIAIHAAFISPHIHWYTPIFNFCILGVPLLIVATVTNGIGGGDVKLLAALCALVGVFSTLLIMITAITIFSMTMLLLRQRKGAFAPAICGAFIVYLFLVFI